MNKIWVTFGVVLVLALHGVQGSKAPEDLAPDTAEANLGTVFYLKRIVGNLTIETLPLCRTKIHPKNVALKILPLEIYP